MPRGDGTGPAGQGPMTGRGLGYCNGFATPGFGKPSPRGMGRGFFGRGSGFRRGYRNFQYPGWNYPTATPDVKTQKMNLENEIKFLSDQLEELKTRLSELSDQE